MQISGDGMAAGERTSQHALRALLVLGGFIAIWWALMTGVAHAESTPDRHLQHSVVDQVRSHLKVQQHRDHPVRDVVRRVHHDVQTTTTKVRHQVARTTKPVAHTVTETVGSTPLAPVTTTVTQKATKTIRTTLSETAATTRALVTETAVGPTVDAVEDTVKDAVQKPESSMEQGNSHSKRHATKIVEDTPSELLTQAFAQQSESSAAAGRTTVSTDTRGPAQGPRGTPSLPDPCSSPSGSGSSSYTPVGTIESSLLVMPSVLRDHHTWSLARLHRGPAFKPSSSPD
jgi:hypothetical protein